MYVLFRFIQNKNSDFYQFFLAIRIGQDLSVMKNEKFYKYIC